MKKILFILTVIAGLLMSSNAEARRIRIPVSNDIPKVATLPDSSYYKTDEGTHLDLSRKTANVRSYSFPNRNPIRTMTFPTNMPKQSGKT